MGGQALDSRVQSDLSIVTVLYSGRVGVGGAQTPDPPTGCLRTLPPRSPAVLPCFSWSGAYSPPGSKHSRCGAVAEPPRRIRQPQGVVRPSAVFLGCPGRPPSWSGGRPGLGGFALSASPSAPGLTCSCCSLACGFCWWVGCGLRLLRALPAAIGSGFCWLSPCSCRLSAYGCFGYRLVSCRL